MAWDKVALAAGLLVALGGLAVLLWPRVRHGLIYPGGAMPADKADPALYGLHDGEEVWLEAEDGVRVHAWWTPADADIVAADRAPDTDAGPDSRGLRGPSRGAVLYCHGNAESMATRAWIAAALVERGYDALLFDYRGYGLSEGRASEEGLARDARAAWRHLVEARSVEPGRVILMGHSLGSAVAARLALEIQAGTLDLAGWNGHAGDDAADRSKESASAGGRDGITPAALIVGSPFPDMPTLFAHHAPWLPDRALRWGSDRLAAGSRLGEVEAPTLVLIGENDETVPPELSRRVYEAARDTAARGPERTDDLTTLVTTPADHGTLMGHPDTWAALDAFLDRIARR